MEPESKPQPPPPPRELAPFVDDQGRLEQWPAKQKTQRMAAAYLASKFEPGRTYNEREVNELLNQWHTFGDWALLRRVLFDWMFLDRESDGSRYRLRPVPPSSGSTSDPASTSPA
jgi:hypothetical protein